MYWANSITIQLYVFNYLALTTITNDRVPEEPWDQTGVLRKWPEVTKNFWEGDVKHESFVLTIIS